MFNTAKSIDSFLRENYPIGKRFTFDDPEKGNVEVQVVIFITDNQAHPTLADGIQIKFDDGELMSIPYHLLV